MSLRFWYWMSRSGKLTEAEQESLRGAQRVWISFRDAEYNWIDEGLYPSEGSMYQLFRLDDRIDFIRSRIAQLQRYLDSIEEFEEE